MHEHRLIAPPPSSTPADLTRSLGRPRELPYDLLKEASLRLGIMSLLFAVLWIVGLTAGHLAARLIYPDSQTWKRFDISDGIGLASAILSASLFVYARRGERDPRFILDLGLWFLVFTAFAIGLVFNLGPAGTGSVPPEISWIGAVVLIFAAMVPTTPRKMVLAALIVVSMNPIAMLISRAQGNWEFGPWTRVLLMHYPDYILVGAAVVITHVMTKLGQQVTKAREMGSYQLGELLGRGGMGEVYKATHRMLARPAAIKLIRPEVIAPSGESAQLANARFRREAGVAARLRASHPGARTTFVSPMMGTCTFSWRSWPG